MSENFLFLFIYCLTIMVIRVGVYLFPDRNLIINKKEIHHFWIGILAIIVSFFTPYFATTLYGIGLALFADELFFMVFGGGNDKNYWSIKSLLGVLIISLLVILFSSTILDFIL